MSAQDKCVQANKGICQEDNAFAPQGWHLPDSLSFLLTLMKLYSGVAADNTPLKKLRVLALHGMGTSSAILKRQLRGLTDLCPDVEFVYLDGQEECPPVRARITVSHPVAPSRPLASSSVGWPLGTVLTDHSQVRLSCPRSRCPLFAPARPGRSGHREDFSRRPLFPLHGARQERGGAS